MTRTLAEGKYFQHFYHGK